MLTGSKFSFTMIFGTISSPVWGSGGKMADYLIGLSLRVNKCMPNAAPRNSKLSVNVIHWHNQQKLVVVTLLLLPTVTQLLKCPWVYLTPKEHTYGFHSFGQDNGKNWVHVKRIFSSSFQKFVGKHHSFLIPNRKQFGKDHIQVELGEGKTFYLKNIIF